MIALWLTSQAFAWDHDYAALDAFLDGAIAGSSVNYPLLASRRPMLDKWLAEAKTAEITGFTPDQQLAFWVNSYNAVTLSVVLDALPLKSILDLDGGKVWDTRSFTLGGAAITLNGIEQSKVRPLGDGRIHAVINCASKGCPPLPSEPLRAQTLELQLDAAARAWVAANAVTISGNEAALSHIFEWYSDDFSEYVVSDIPGVDGKSEAGLSFCAKYANPDVAVKLTSGKLVAKWAEYDWSLNAK